MAAAYAVAPPVFGAGPYVMLPGMTYTWRVRTTAATTFIDENSPLWGPWSQPFSFRTRTAFSSTIIAVAPADGSAVTSLTPVLRWDNADRGVFYYEVQLSTDSSFDTNPATATAMIYWPLLHGGATNPPNSYAIPASAPLQPALTYYWRVRPRIQGDGSPVAWSSTFSFRAP
jgi:hypothetical protein